MVIVLGWIGGSVLGALGGVGDDEEQKEHVGGYWWDEAYYLVWNVGNYLLYELHPEC